MVVGKGGGIEISEIARRERVIEYIKLIYPIINKPKHQEMDNGWIVSLVAPTSGSDQYRVLATKRVSAAEPKLRISDLPASIRPDSISVTGYAPLVVQSYTTPRGVTGDLTMNDWISILTQDKKDTEDRPIVTVYRTEGLPTVRGRVEGYQVIPGGSGSMLVMIDPKDDALSLVDVSHIGGFDMPMSASVFDPKASKAKTNDMDIFVKGKGSVGLGLELLDISVTVQTSVRHSGDIALEESARLSDGASIFWNTPYLARPARALAYPFVNIDNRTGQDIDDIQSVRFPRLLANDVYASRGTPRRASRVMYAETVSRSVTPTPTLGTEAGEPVGMLIDDWEAPSGKRIVFGKGRLSRALPVSKLQTYEFALAALDESSTGDPIPVYKYMWIKEGALFPCTMAFLDADGNRHGESHLKHILTPKGRDHALVRVGRNADIALATSSQIQYFSPEENRKYESRAVYEFRVDNNSGTQDYASVMLYVDVPKGRSECTDLKLSIFQGVISTPKNRNAVLKKVGSESIFAPLRTTSLSNQGYNPRSVDRWMVTFVGIPRGGCGQGSFSAWTKRL